MEKPAQNMAEIVQHLERKAQEEQAKAEVEAANRMIEAQIRIISSAYDKAATYTNLIIIAGYAAFFGLWSNTKDHLSGNQELWSALLMIVSLATFVLFEVTKNYFSSKILLKQSAMINDPELNQSVPLLTEAFNEYESTLRKSVIAWGKWWHFAFILTVATGVPAIFILLWSFIAELLKSHGVI